MPCIAATVSRLAPAGPCTGRALGRRGAARCRAKPIKRPQACRPVWDFDRPVGHALVRVRGLAARATSACSCFVAGPAVRAGLLVWARTSSLGRSAQDRCFRLLAQLAIAAQRTAGFHARRAVRQTACCSSIATRARLRLRASRVGYGRRVHRRPPDAPEGDTRGPQGVRWCRGFSWRRGTPTKVAMGDDTPECQCSAPNSPGPGPGPGVSSVDRRRGGRRAWTTQCPQPTGRTDPVDPEGAPLAWIHRRGHDDDVSRGCCRRCLVMRVKRPDPA